MDIRMSNFVGCLRPENHIACHFIIFIKERVDERCDKRRAFTEHRLHSE